MKQAHQDFIDEFEKDEVTISMSVEIEFGDNRFNTNQVCSASSIKDETRGIENDVRKNLTDFWKAEQAFNNRNYNTMKWLVCDAGAELDESDTGATYRCIDLDEVEDMELGWWSQTRSHASTGVFATPQWVKAEWYTSPSHSTPAGRPVNKFVLYLDENYPNMLQINAEYKNAAGSWVSIFGGTRNLAVDEYKVEVEIEGDPLMVYGLRATVNSTRNPDDYARISEFNALFVETFSESDYIVQGDINEIREQYEDSTPIGITGANSFDFELDNTERLFSLNGDSIYAPYLVNNCRVIPRIHAAGHYVQMGEYWTDDWDESGSGMSVNVKCRDFSKFLQDTKEGFSRTYTDCTLQLPFVDLLSINGFRYQDMSLAIESSRVYPIIFLHDQSVWELFGELGLAGGVIFNFNSEGDFVLSNSKVAKPSFYDNFNRDMEDVLLVDLPQPTMSNNNQKWSEYTQGFFINDGKISIPSGFGAGAISRTTDSFYIDIQLSTFGDDDIVIVASADPADDLATVGLSIDASQNKAMFSGPGEVTRPLFNTNITDTSILTLKVTPTGMTFYVDSVQKGTIELSIASNEMCGFYSFSNGGTATEYDSFTIRPIDESIMTFAGSTNIEEGSTKSDIWTNEVVVKISEFSKDGHGTMRLWGPENPTILSYSRLQTGISPTATTIQVEREVRQENGLLADNGWPKYDGIIFIPEFSGSECIGGELIKYDERKDRSFVGCKRGYLNTTAQTWASNTYLGEAREWDVEFDGAPALEVNWPFSTAIDTLGKEPGYVKQAYIPIFTHDGFTGKIVIGNIAKYLTILEGDGEAVSDFDNKKEDVKIPFNTAISGVVANGGENKQKVVRKLDDPTAKDEERIRKYGRNKVEIQNRWIQSREHAQAVADAFIDEYGTPRFILNLSTISPPILELGDRVTVSTYENMAITNIDYHVVEIKSSFDGGLGIELVLRQA